MKTEKMIDQLELYGNAICGFVVVQSIGFAYALGTNFTLKCIAFFEKVVNIFLTGHFAACGIAACFALHFISKSIRRLSNENQNLVRRVHIGKMAAVTAFVALPIYLLSWYGTGLHMTVEQCLAASGK